MSELVNTLDYEQRYVFDAVLTYCKDMRKVLHNNMLAPYPPLLIVHGGYGTGNSLLINVLTL